MPRATSSWGTLVGGGQGPGRRRGGRLVSVAVFGCGSIWAWALQQLGARFGTSWLSCLYIIKVHHSASFRHHSAATDHELCCAARAAGLAKFNAAGTEADLGAPPAALPTLPIVTAAHPKAGVGSGTQRVSSLPSEATGVCGTSYYIRWVKFGEAPGGTGVSCPLGCSKQAGGDPP